jgi:hypothetical protein
VKKELDVLFDAGRGACASLRIAKSSELLTVELVVKLKLVPDLVEDWKMLAARGGARTALTLAKAHYSDLSLDLVTSGIPNVNEDGTLVDEPAIRQSMLRDNHMCSFGTRMNVYYERHLLPDSPSGA